jgi:hypothetical protein
VSCPYSSDSVFVAFRVLKICWGSPLVEHCHVWSVLSRLYGSSLMLVEAAVTSRHWSGRYQRHTM